MFMCILGFGWFRWFWFCGFAVFELYGTGIWLGCLFGFYLGWFPEFVIWLWFCFVYLDVGLAIWVFRLLLGGLVVCDFGCFGYLGTIRWVLWFVCLWLSFFQEWFWVGFSFDLELCLYDCLVFCLFEFVLLGCCVLLLFVLLESVGFGLLVGRSCVKLHFSGFDLE